MRNNSIGLVPATRTAGTVAFKKTNCSATVNVPSGAQWLRVALFKLFKNWLSLVAFTDAGANFGLAAAISTVIFFLVALMSMANLKFTQGKEGGR